MDVRNLIIIPSDLPITEINFMIKSRPMKKLAFKFLLVGLASVFFISCGSSLLLKRKYTSGYYLGNFSVAKSKKSEIKSENKTQNLFLSADLKSENLLLPLSSIEGNEIVENTHSEILNKVKTNNTSSENSSPSKFGEIKVIKSSIKQQSNNGTTQVQDMKSTLNNISLKSKNTLMNDFKMNQPYDEDTMNIIMLILCLLVPPLGVYLKARSANKWFWITLLLCLLSGGIFFGIGAMGTGWFVAFIIALLYVLEVVK